MSGWSAIYRENLVVASLVSAGRIFSYPDINFHLAGRSNASNVSRGIWKVVDT